MWIDGIGEHFVNRSATRDNMVYTLIMYKMSRNMFVGVSVNLKTILAIALAVVLRFGYTLTCPYFHTVAVLNSDHNCQKGVCDIHD